MDDDGRRQLDWLAGELARLAQYLDDAVHRTARDPDAIFKAASAEAKALKTVAEQAAERGKVRSLHDK